jgi:hypothetical protein
MYKLNQEYYELQMWVLQGNHTQTAGAKTSETNLHFLKITE